MWGLAGQDNRSCGAMTETTPAMAIGPTGIHRVVATLETLQTLAMQAGAMSSMCAKLLK